jgi:hypothetical protein
MKRRHFIFALLLAMSACAKQSTIPPFQEDILYQMEDNYLLKPDSAFSHPI